jgi:hypothetical protein
MVTHTGLDPSSRRLSSGQVTAIRAAMQLFIKDALDSGLRVNQRRYCDADDAPRCAAGFIACGDYQLCNDCAAEYAMARTCGLVTNPGQYVRDRRFGEMFDVETT